MFCSLATLRSNWTQMVACFLTAIQEFSLTCWNIYEEKVFMWRKGTKRLCAMRLNSLNWMCLGLVTSMHKKMIFLRPLSSIVKDGKLSDLTVAFEKLYEAELKSILEEERKLVKEQASWSRRVEKLLKIHTKEKIKLNIGGSIFCASRATLTSGDNYFSRLLEGGLKGSFRDGAYFVDRSPKVFQFVLDLMRGCDNFNLTDAQLSALRTACDYYQVPIPEKLIKKSDDWFLTATPNCVLSDGNLSATKGSKCKIEVWLFYVLLLFFLW